MTVTEKAKDKIAKPVYFNISNDKEKEIVDWIDGKFSSFGGLVKDLLYQQMLKEKNGIQPIQFIETKLNIDEVAADPSEVADFDY